MTKPSSRHSTAAAWRTVIGLVLAAAVFLTPAYGQYFGRNKVQWEKFDYRVLKTDHFDIYYYPQEEAAIRVAARMAERWYKRFSRLLNHELRGKQPLIMYASHPQFEQTTVLTEIMSEGTGGITESSKRRIILPFGGTLEDTDHVIGHELVHAFQYDMAAGGGPKVGQQGGGYGLEQAPLWFVEGAAEYLSIGPVDTHTAMWMRDLLQKKKLPTIKQLINPYRYFPYRYGQAVWAYIGGKYGDMAVAKLLKDVVRGFDYEKAIPKDLGIDVKKLSEEWHASLRHDYEPIQKATFKPTDLGKLLLQGSDTDPYNIAPALSPDGKRFMFISSRDLYSIDMFLGDAKTGKVQRKITSTAVDPHFQSIQFINSSGSWSSDGSRFVFGAINDAKPVLAFLDANGRRVDEDIKFKELGEILNPTWSPDASKIAFSALSGGFSDLYIYDLKAKSLKAMTADPFGDLQPTWSPDGRWIAFVTERFNTQLQTLDIGSSRLALLDPETGEIKPLAGFRLGKSINPQWSPDSKSLYFVSDRSGISNVYRVNVASGALFQVSDLFTGVSGITGLSPTLSVAAKSEDVLYSVYQEGNYSIYSIDKDKLAGKPVQDTDGAVMANVLPPSQRSGSEVLGLLKSPLFGLPQNDNFASQPYKPKLTLDYVMPPQVGIGVSRYGTYAGGGVAFVFSDMLGLHNLLAVAQIYNRLSDSAFQVGYFNSANRLNWGAVVQRIPYLYGGGYNLESTFLDGYPVLKETDYVYRQVNYDAGGFASYPFNQFRRFELNAGYSYITFSNTIYTTYYSAYDYTVLAQDVEDKAAGSALHMPYVGGAFVYDSSLFGATAPIIGQSYRAEVTPTFGTLNYTSVLLDYRKYIVPVRPFTLALRFVGYGRFGKGSDDTRLYPLFLGYETLIRGYDWESLTNEEYSAGGFDVDRLVGSKMLLANFELRFPLFGLLGLGRGYYGIFPLDFIAFYDMGVAWGKYSLMSYTPTEHKPWFMAGGDRKLLRSMGIGVRANILGYIVLGINYVKPLDRPLKGWYWEFTFYPGF